MVQALFGLRYVSEQELLGDYPLSGAFTSMGLSFLSHLIQFISMTVLSGDGICCISYSVVKEVCFANHIKWKGAPLIIGGYWAPWWLKVYYRNPPKH